MAEAGVRPQRTHRLYSIIITADAAVAVSPLYVLLSFHEQHTIRTDARSDVHGVHVGRTGRTMSSILIRSSWWLVRLHMNG